MQVKNIFRISWPFVASALLLTVIQPPISLSPLAWVSLVPFILACSPTAKTKPLAITTYLVSLIYWLGNLYWVFPITIVGWAAFCLYTALLWPIVALGLRYCRIKNIPLILAVPILFVGAERLQGLFLGGFFWRFLAHSQYRNITLIQIADIFGAAGVSFLIAMVNGLIADLILAARQKKLLQVSNFLKTAVLCITLLATVLYGRWRVNQSDKFIEAGPLVAALQSNVPQSVKRTFKADREIFDDLMKQSTECTKAGPQLIVWPETMVQAMLNRQVWRFLKPEEIARITVLDAGLAEHSKDNAFVLAGAYAAQMKYPERSRPYLATYNSAFLYRPDGTQAREHYDKIHLVPFGEVVPFKRKLPWLFNFLMKFTPYNYDYSLDAGTQYTIFHMTDSADSPDAAYKFGVMICYEGTIPYIARRFARDNRGRKAVDWLVNISNDGWFVRFNNQTVSPSTELPQHTAICAFRAVENRLAILRSVNTGISCLIDTLGRVRDGYKAASPDFPIQAMKRTGIAGWFVDEMPIDKRETIFSKYGQWLDFCCAACVVLLIIVMAGKRLVLAKRQ
ncbi:MAG: apolipoprotein N-acyltransferase [Planctomycetota bacterium]